MPVCLLPARLQSVGWHAHAPTAGSHCSVCNEAISLYKDESCQMSGWVYNSSTKLEEKTCDICDYKETKQHVHSSAPSNIHYSFYKTNNNCGQCCIYSERNKHSRANAIRQLFFILFDLSDKIEKG